MLAPFEKELSPGVTLFREVEKREREGSDDVDDVKITYSLSVAGDRSVVFDIDFSGSTNLRLLQCVGRQEGSMRVKNTVKPGSEKCIVGVLVVEENSKSWMLETKYTWVERQSVVKEIARNIFLETVDIWSKGRTMTSIEYNLTVKKHRRVIFDIDFSKSENLELVGGGFKRRTKIEPFKTAQVAYLQIVDVGTKQWSLKCHYDWSEERPNQTPVGGTEKKELAPGILLITTRIKDTAFQYEILSSKSSFVDFTLDCTQSENMALESGGTLAKTTVDPFSRIKVGIVKVKDLQSSWSLKSKFSWTERQLQRENLRRQSHVLNRRQKLGQDASRRHSQLVEPIRPILKQPSNPNHTDRVRNLFRPEENPQAVREEDTNKRFHPKTVPKPSHFVETKSTVPKVSRAVGKPYDARGVNGYRNIEAKRQPSNNEKSIPNAKPSYRTEEVSPGIFLNTENTIGNPTRIIYTLNVQKQVNVAFELDFSGSENMILLGAEPRTPFRKRTIVEPLSPTVVAELFVKDNSPSAPWKVSCKYKWEEIPLTKESVPEISPSRVGESSHPESPSYPELSSHSESPELKTEASVSSLSRLLAGIGLEKEYSNMFESQALDLELLQSIAQQDRNALRESLKEAGVNLLGHREKIVLAVVKSI